MEDILHSMSESRELPYLHHTTYAASPLRHFPVHTHDFCELLFLRSGSVTYSVEGRNYQLEKNDLVITRPAKLHSVHVEGDKPYERFNLQFNTDLLLPEVWNMIPDDLDVLHLDDGHIIIYLFQKMDYYFQQLTEPEFHRIMYLLVEEIFFNIRLLAEQHPNHSTVSGNPLIQKIIAYIEEHISTLSGIEEICNALFISKSYMHHQFVRYMQITPKQYILSKRLALAQQAIRSGEKPTKIYLQYGFNSYATFFRSYKQHFGCSPSDELYFGSNRDILS